MEPPIVTLMAMTEEGTEQGDEEGLPKAARVNMVAMLGGGRAEVRPGPDLSGVGGFDRSGARCKPPRTPARTVSNDHIADREPWPWAPPTSATCLDASDDGSVAAIGTSMGHVLIWDLARGGLMGAFGVGRDGSMTADGSAAAGNVDSDSGEVGSYLAKSIVLHKSTKGGLTYAAGLDSRDGLDSVLVVGLIRNIQCVIK